MFSIQQNVDHSEGLLRPCVPAFPHVLQADLHLRRGLELWGSGGQPARH